ncbi:MAG: hypothetical protein R6U39_01400 [Candidatus Aegiribacteria sp.]
MTGLAAHGDYLYLASRSQSRTYRYSLPGIYGRTAAIPFERGSGTLDIARDPRGLIWAADEKGDCSLKCYDTAGTVVAGVGRDLVSSASGVAMDNSGILWVSCDDDRTIYGIDVSE